MPNLRMNVRRLAVASVAAGGLSLAAAPSAFAASSQLTPTPTNGTNATTYTLPDVGQGYACPKPTNTANGDILESFLVDDSLFPSSQLSNMTYDAGGGDWDLNGNQSYGVLYEYNGSSFNANGGTATDPTTGSYPTDAGGPFSLNFYVEGNDYSSSGASSGLDLYPGVFNEGIACVSSTGTVDSTLVYAQITVTDNGENNDSGFTWTAQTVTTPEFPLAAVVPAVAVGILGAGVLIRRRRSRAAAITA